MKIEEIRRLHEVAKDILGQDADASAVATLLSALLIRDSLNQLGNAYVHVARGDF